MRTLLCASILLAVLYVVHARGAWSHNQFDENVAMMLQTSYIAPRQDCPQSSSKCSMACFFHGRCDEESGTCDCHDGWTGEDCTEQTCDTCSIHGECCDNENGCCCHVGWTGERCDKLVGIKPFLRPLCTMDGTCVCNERGDPCPEDTLPNLQPLLSRSPPFIEYLSVDNCSCALDAGCLGAPGIRKVLRFDTYTFNAGTADLFIGDISEHWDKYTWHQCHHHPHFEEWAIFQIRNKDTGEIAAGAKSGSTIIDSLRHGTSGSYRPRYRDDKQGISIGWTDWYPYWYDCQWVDVTDLPYGNYELVVESNPNRMVKESTYDDNIISVDLGCTDCENGDCDFGECVCHHGWMGPSCTTSSEGHCEPECTGRSCGSDLCGGSCGTCRRGYHCDDGICTCSALCYTAECGSDGCGQDNGCGLCLGGSQYQCRNHKCECTPNCNNRECGHDGCGGECGSCDVGVCQQYECVAECIPECSETNECGPDGCGGLCGICGAGEHCEVVNDEVYTCGCSPKCALKDCGDDECGGTCGTCSDDETCTEDGHCVCIPDCAGKMCGDDGCGGSCGPCDGICIEEGFCIDCEIDCEGRERGHDGCGGSCGSCDSGDICTDEGECVCIPDCSGKQCGDDGCGGQCGTCQNCSADFTCPDVCTPNCNGRECGHDDCGGSCGHCSSGDVCTDEGECVCIPNCSGKQCGDDGCGGTCGHCGAQECVSFQCKCVTECNGRECGRDGCGGSCGTCEDGKLCSDDGKCMCIPDCDGKECGSNGCGGSCGTCGMGECSDHQCSCTPQCDDRECGNDSCGGSCGSCNPSENCIKGSCVVMTVCQPDCEGRECGSDGCNGVCGTCDKDALCINDWQCFEHFGDLDVFSMVTEIRFMNEPRDVNARQDTFIDAVADCVNVPQQSIGLMSWAEYSSSIKVLFTVYMPSDVDNSDVVEKLSTSSHWSPKGIDLLSMARVDSSGSSNASPSSSEIASWVWLSLAGNALFVLAVLAVVVGAIVLAVRNYRRRQQFSQINANFESNYSIGGDDDDL